MNEKRRLGKAKQWWREAKFGVFLHWTPQALPDAWTPEFMSVEGRKRLPARFNPVRFDAVAWVREVKRCGARYIVFTSKHIDGFAMFHSKCNPFNIVEASPFKRDILKELAQACHRLGMRFGIYYVQDYDMEDPGGTLYDCVTPHTLSPPEYEAFQERKTIPQVRELLTQYGPVDILWFDHPKSATPRMSARLDRLVRKLQPDCVVSGRLVYGLGDYHSCGDHQVPVGRIDADFEVCDTSNADWFYTEKGWKPARNLLRILVDIASKGGNYLLNVGPKPDGTLPAAGVSRLRHIGRWLEKNGESLYGTRACPWPYVFDWGRVTTNDNKLFLHIFDWPGRPFELYGLRNRVRRAYLLANRRAPVAFTQTRDAVSNGPHVLRLDLPRRAPDRDVSVVVLDLNGPADVETALAQLPDGSVQLPALHAEMSPALYWGVMRVGQGACVSDWYSIDNWLSWTFQVPHPGEFDVELETKAVSLAGWKGGHRVQVNLNGKTLAKTLKAEPVPDALDSHFHTYVNRIGRVTIAQAGRCVLTLRALKINPQARGGLTPVCVRLIPRVASKPR